LAGIVEALVDVVGRECVLTGDAVAARVTSFWSDAPMRAKALVLPVTTEQISRVLRSCHEHDQTVVVQGGLTNAVTAAVSSPADVALSLERMNRVVEIDGVGGTAVVEAGAILQNVQEAVADAGLYFPLDLGARGSCTIGGNIATNAGGINVLRYGMMRNLVLGLEAVLADGTTISSMNRMLKNNAGYDVKQLFIGTEGTLGIVTRAVLRLFPRPAARHNALVAMEDFAAVAGFLSRLRERAGDSLCAFEIMWRNYYAGLTADGGYRAPMSRDYPYYVIAQLEGREPEADAERFETILAGALEDGLIVDAVIPKSDAETQAIWKIREGFEPLLKPEPVFVYDVSLPIAHMPEYVGRVEENIRGRWRDGECYSLGHVADGNLHFMVHPRDRRATHNDSDRCVYEPLADFGGSVSAEHGIGTEKIAWLPSCRSSAEIGLMRSLKHSLDPKNLLNRGRVVPS
jgi:FAD/FMN-containing dehydrogenase